MSAWFGWFSKDLSGFVEEVRKTVQSQVSSSQLQETLTEDVEQKQQPYDAFANQTTLDSPSQSASPAASNVSQANKGATAQSQAQPQQQPQQQQNGQFVQHQNVQNLAQMSQQMNHNVNDKNAFAQNRTVPHQQSAQAQATQSPSSQSQPPQINIFDPQIQQQLMQQMQQLQPDQQAIFQQQIAQLYEMQAQHQNQSPSHNEAQNSNAGANPSPLQTMDGQQLLQPPSHIPNASECDPSSAQQPQTTAVGDAAADFEANSENNNNETHDKASPYSFNPEVEEWQPTYFGAASAAPNEQIQEQLFDQLRNLNTQITVTQHHIDNVINPKLVSVNSQIVMYHQPANAALLNALQHYNKYQALVLQQQQWNQQLAQYQFSLVQLQQQLANTQTVYQQHKDAKYKIDDTELEAPNPFAAQYAFGAVPLEQITGWRSISATQAEDKRDEQKIVSVPPANHDPAEATNVMMKSHVIEESKQQTNDAIVDIQDIAHYPGWGYDQNASQWDHEIVLQWITEISDEALAEYEWRCRSNGDPVTGTHFTRDRLGDAKWLKREIDGLPQVVCDRLAVVVRQRLTSYEQHAKYKGLMFAERALASQVDHVSELTRNRLHTKSVQRQTGMLRRVHDKPGHDNMTKDAHREPANKANHTAGCGQIICAFRNRNATDIIPTTQDLYSYFGQFGKVINTIKVERNQSHIRKQLQKRCKIPVQGGPTAVIRFQSAQSVKQLWMNKKTNKKRNKIRIRIPIESEDGTLFCYGRVTRCDGKCKLIEKQQAVVSQSGWKKEQTELSEIYNIKSMGDECAAQNRHKLAIQHYSKAIQNCTEFGDTILLQKLLFNRAKSYFYLHQYEDVLTDIRSCIAVSDESQLSYRARCILAWLMLKVFNDCSTAVQHCDIIINARLKYPPDSHIKKAANKLKQVIQRSRSDESRTMHRQLPHELMASFNEAPDRLSISGFELPLSHFHQFEQHAKYEEHNKQHELQALNNPSLLSVDSQIPMYQNQQTYPQQRLVATHALYQQHKDGDNQANNGSLMSEEQLSKTLSDVLQQMTPETFSDIVQSMATIVRDFADTPDRMEQTVGMVLRFAISRPVFARQYAELCHHLFVHVPKLAVSSNWERAIKDDDISSTFRTMVIQQANALFTKYRHHSPQALDIHLDEKHTEIQDAEDLSPITTKKDAFLAVMVLVAELYNVGLIRKNLIYNGVFNVLLPPKNSELSAVDLEGLCRVFKQCGEKLDGESKKHVDRMLEKMTKYASQFDLETRLLVLEIYEMRANHWKHQDRDNQQKQGQQHVQDDENEKTQTKWRKKEQPQNSPNDIHGSNQQSVHSDLEDKNLCIVCQDAKKDHVLVPCFHVCICGGCKELYTSGGATCPICRTTVQSVNKVYL